MARNVKDVPSRLPHSPRLHTVCRTDGNSFLKLRSSQKHGAIGKTAEVRVNDHSQVGKLSSFGVVGYCQHPTWQIKYHELESLPSILYVIYTHYLGKKKLADIELVLLR